MAQSSYISLRKMAVNFQSRNCTELKSMKMKGDGMGFDFFPLLSGHLRPGLAWNQA